jgi:hypothetical protein
MRPAQVLAFLLKTIELIPDEQWELSDWLPHGGWLPEDLFAQAVQHAPDIAPVVAQRCHMRTLSRLLELLHDRLPWKSFTRCQRELARLQPEYKCCFLLYALKKIPPQNWNWAVWIGNDATLPARLCAFAAQHGDRDAVLRLLNSRLVKKSEDLDKAKIAATEAGHHDIANTIIGRLSPPTSNDAAPANPS